MPNSFLSEVILIIGAAFVGGFVARSFKLPPVLGYIVSGVIFGIIGKSFFESYDSLVEFSQFGVSLLLFTLGFEISFDFIKKLNKTVILAGIAQVIVGALAVFPALLIFGLNVNVAILFSVLFSFSSTAVVIKLLEEKGMLDDFPGNHVLIYLLLQDLLVVPVIFFLPLIFSDGNLTSGLIGEFILSIAKPVIIFALIYLFGRIFLSKIIHFLFRYPSPELSILASIFTATLSIILLSAVGLPSTIAAFMAGVLISEQGKNLAPMTAIKPFRDLFLVLFFVVTGMLLDFNFFFNNLPLILALSLTVLLIKFAVIYLVLRIYKNSPSSSVFISSYLSNIGEFSIVIGQVAFLSFFITQKDYNLILSIFITTLILIPFWLKYSRATMEKLARLGLLGKILDREDDKLQNEKTKDYENHVVICGHGRVGRETRAMLDLAEIEYIVVDFNRQVISELIKQSKYAIYGDPTDTDILKAAFIDKAAVLVVAVPETFAQKKIIELSLKMNPKLAILCRSHVEEDRYDLINLGVTTLIMPEVEAGLRTGVEVLSHYNVNPDEIDSYIKRLRREHLL